MNAYADTSALFALFHPRDLFNPGVCAHVGAATAELFYPSWLRFELRHTLTLARVDADGETAWRALLAGERRRLRGVRQDALGVIQLAGELSARHARDCPDAGALDVLHAAAALELGAAEFWTCDEGQADFARAAGLQVVQFQPESGKRTR